MKNTQIPLKLIAAVIAGGMLIAEPAIARLGGSGGRRSSSSRSSSRRSSSSYHSSYSSGSSRRSSSWRSHSSGSSHSTHRSNAGYYGAAAAAGVAAAAYNSEGSDNSTNSSSTGTSNEYNGYSSSYDYKPKRGPGFVFWFIAGGIIYIGYRRFKKNLRKAREEFIKAKGGITNEGDDVFTTTTSSSTISYIPSPIPYPAGLDNTKVTRAFLVLQEAWQQQDLSKVRMWLSDGMYQKFATQFNIMRVLGQSNTMSNIHIHSINAVSHVTDGDYEVSDVAISFSMDDSFRSIHYPQLNEDFAGEYATEYWSFIRKKGVTGDKTLYDGHCPNCGALFATDMGEISQCKNCNTVTNNATFDWVLTEITQSEYYTGGLMANTAFAPTGIMKHDPYFSIQRMEDLASNIFVRIMDAFTGGDTNQLGRFATSQIAEDILNNRPEEKKQFVFDRLYLNSVTYRGYDVKDGIATMQFDLNAVYRRVIPSDILFILDEDFVESEFQMELSRRVPNSTSKKETTVNHECNSCGAPFEDTANGQCSYCGAAASDIEYNWVLTRFAGLKEEVEMA